MYKDQDIEVVTKWLRKLMRSQVEAAYQTVRKEYLLPPTTAVARPPSGVPTTDYPSPSSPIASECAGPDASSDLAKGPGDSARLIPSPQADASKQGSGRAGGDDSPRSDGVVDQPSRKRRRRRSNPKEGDIKAAGEPERLLILQADIVETIFDADPYAQRGWARSRNVARRQVQTRPTVRGSDRGRGTRAVYNWTPSHSPVCDFRLRCSLSSAGCTEGEHSEGAREIYWLCEMRGVVRSDFVYYLCE